MASKRFVYLDYAASAPIRPEALAAIERYRSLPCSMANPNSLHTLGRAAARELDGARRTLARCLGGRFRAGEVAFTSGGTESNNAAALGMAEGARRRDRSRTRVVLSAIEHDSVLDVASALRERGFAVDFVRPDRSGVVSAEALAACLRADVAVCSVMAANNETGVIQPTAELARAAHAAGALVHVDAVQAFGRVPLEVDDADAVSVAAHKIGGPVGVGALAMRARCPFGPQSFGGGQEQGRRAGTQDVCGAVAFAAVAEAVCASLAETREVVAERARHVYERLCAPGTHILPSTDANVSGGRLPGMVSLLVEGIDSETLILSLDEAGFEVSAGSACSSGSLDPSHVLSAMGIPRELALGSLRVSFDERVDPSDLDAFCDELLAVVARRS